MLNDRQHTQVSQLVTPTGNLDRAVAAQAWIVPRQIRQQGDRLIWEYSEDNYGRGRRVTPGPGMLEDFVKLGEMPDSYILRYAQHWGVLNICEHLLPASHSAAASGAAYLGCFPLGWDDRICWEPLERWRHFAGQAFALLRIANRVHLGKTADPEDWRRVYARSEHGVPLGKKPNLVLDRHYLTACLNEWLALGNVRPQLEWWSEQGPSVKFSTSGLFGALALQLVLSAAQLEGWAICTHCRLQYIPTRRRPKANQRNFCPACRADNVPPQYAMRDYRGRQQQSKRAPKR